MGEIRPEQRNDGWPTRADMQLWTPAERAIQDAIDIVERVGAGIALTDAVILLGNARNRVADYVEGTDNVVPTPNLQGKECREYECPFKRGDAIEDNVFLNQYDEFTHPAPPYPALDIRSEV